MDENGKVTKTFTFEDSIFDEDILENLFIESKIPLGTKCKITLEPIVD